LAKETLSHPRPRRSQSYTPKFLADKILTTRSSIEGSGRRDGALRRRGDYTALTEKLDPEESRDHGRLLPDLMDEIHRYEGTINQFTGDG